MYLSSRKPQSKPKKPASPKGSFVVVGFIVLAAILAGGFFLVQKQTKNKNNTQLSPAVSFDKRQFSLTDPASPWVIVNKKRPLEPKNYEPADLRTPKIKVESPTQKVNDQTATALEALFAAAAGEGVNLALVSAYRSYALQAVIYDSEVRGYGQAQADRESARPGHSEHQTGWAADLGAASGKCELQACFADTPEGRWLAANAHKYGFVIRYAEGKEQITGYIHEPWHLRYVSKELSQEMHRTGLKTLEEFFNLPAASSY